MADYNRFAFLFLLFFLVSGNRNISAQSDKPGTTQPEKRKPNFASDTLVINENYDLARSYLYQDAFKAITYAKQVLRLSQKHQWDKGKLMAYNLISTIYLLDGSYDVLRELSSETFMLCKKHDMPEFAAHAHRFQAESFSEFRKWDSAQVHYRQAIKIFTKLNQDSARAVCLENMGNSFRENDHYDEANRHYDQSMQLFEKLGSDWGKATVLQSKGFLYVRAHDHEKAKSYFLQSLDLFKKVNNRYGRLNAVNDLANVYMLDKEYDKSIAAALEALELSKLYHSSQQSNWALECLSRAYKGKNDLAKALYYNEQVNYNRHILHNEQIQRKFTMYQLIYDNQLMNSAIQEKIIDEQKRIQLVLIGFSCFILAFAAFLWFNNKNLRRKNAAIKEALIQGQKMERKRVAAELHDHLGGTLASLNWYLYGIDKKILSPEEQKIYDSVHQMVGVAYREVRSLSHNLMPAELEEHGLVMAIQRLIGKLNENNSIPFSFHVSGLDKRLSNKIEFELYSIVLELTTNILKHSSATQAEISLTETNRNVTLVVSDNGNGIKNNSEEGIGLGNVKNRVESLFGSVKIFDGTVDGTRIEINIPNSQFIRL